jgi:hypothetical protein
MTILRRGKSKFWYIQFQIGGRTIIKSSRSSSRKIAEQMSRMSSGCSIWWPLNPI